MQNYYLYHNGNDWALKKQDADRASKVFTGMTKDEAVGKLSESVSNASVKIKKMDGTFQEERTYPRSIDPHESPG